MLFSIQNNDIVWSTYASVTMNVCVRIPYKIVIVYAQKLISVSSPLMRFHVNEGTVLSKGNLLMIIIIYCLSGVCYFFNQMHDSYNWVDFIVQNTSRCRL